jgi:Chorismate synthase
VVKPTSSILDAGAQHRPLRQRGRTAHQGPPRSLRRLRATPVAEAMVACVLADHLLRHRAQCG